MTNSKQLLDAVRRHARKMAEHEAARNEAIRAAVAGGVPSSQVAEVAGVSAGRVSQIAPRAEAVQPRPQAGKKTCGVSCDSVPGLPGPEVATLSGHVSVRRRRPYARATAFYDVRSGVLLTDQGARVQGIPGEPGSLAHVLASVAMTPEVARVYLTGPAPVDESSGATAAEQVRAWVLGEPGPGWATAERGHYLADADLPVCRYVDTSGRQVTVQRAATWWGESDADVDVALAAWIGLGRAIDEVPAFKGAGLGDAPASFGRGLWLRTIPEGRSYPVLSDEYRALIRATSGQGRIERLPEPEAAKPEGFTYMDGRLMYAALTWGMPVGEPRRWTGAEVDALTAAEAERVLRGRGRWLVTATVPEGWAHLGLLGAKAEGGGWTYPRQPGQAFTTWADGCEVWQAMSHGWPIHIHEGFTMAEAKPLDAWTKSLTAVWERAKAAEARGNEAAGLAAKAVRSIIIKGLGAFATPSHNVTGSTPADTPEAVPDDVLPGTVRRVGDYLTWERPGTVTTWQAETMHPEWSATVWARARVRLLDAPGAAQGQRVGALHVPLHTIVAMATDALYLAGDAPHWTDDGKPGRFRVKGHRPGPFAWPSSALDLYRLRDEAEAGAW